MSSARSTPEPHQLAQQGAQQIDERTDRAAREPHRAEPAARLARTVRWLGLASWGLLLLLVLALGLALGTLPWMRTVPGWTLPSLIGCGVALGALLVGGRPAGRWWSALLQTGPLFGLGLLLGAVLTGVGLLAGQSAPGARIPSLAGLGGLGSWQVGVVLLGVYTVCLMASLPWLLWRGRQPWLALVPVWVTSAGAWALSGRAAPATGGTQGLGRSTFLAQLVALLQTQPAWWLLWLLALSVALLGVVHLRTEAQIWQREAFALVGPAFAPALRAVVVSAALVAVIGALPIGVAELPAVRRWWDQTALAQNPPLALSDAQGAALAVLGAPLSVDTPAPAGQQVIARVRITGRGDSGVELPPLLGATLDRFSGSTWSMSPVASRAVPADANVVFPPGATALEANITLVQPPAAAGTTFLLGFSEPVRFALPARVHQSAQARVILTALSDAQAPSALTPLALAGWQTLLPLSPGTTYRELSATVPADPAATGTLPTALHAQLTELPPALVPLLRDTVRAWLAPATPTTASPTGLSAVAQARALEAVVDAHLRLDAQAAGPRGSDPTRWSLEQHRASALVLTSDFILLGRALGLPLRLAEGYLPSDFDTETQVHEVRARDATDWAQLAVAGLGWLDLFPAAHQLAAALPPPSQVHTLPTPAPWPTASAAPTATPQAANAPLRAGVPAAAPRARGSGPAQPWPLLVLIGVAGVVALLLARRRWRWQRFLARLTPLARFFARLARLARLAGLELRPSDTAAQATAKVVAAVVPEDAATHTTTRTTLLTLNGFYERLRYGPPGSALGGWPDLRAAWADLRGRLWRRALAGPWRPRRSSSRHHTARRQ